MARKPNPPLPAGSPGEIIPPIQPDPLAADEWGVKVASVGFALDLDPAIVVDRMTRSVLAHTRDSILAGTRPDNGGPQKALSRQALSVDRQSPNRGYRTGHLADGIKRSKIKRSGFKASSRIVPPSNRNVYVAEERKRGVNLLTLAGRSGEAARAAAREAVKEIAQGGQVPKTDKELEAEDVK